MKTKTTLFRSMRKRRILTILICLALIPVVVLAFSTMVHAKKDDKDGGKDDKGGGKDDKKQKPREDKHEKPINTDFDLFSVGKNGDYSKRLDNWKSADDIIRASQGEYVGLASKY